MGVPEHNNVLNDSILKASYANVLRNNNSANRFVNKLQYRVRNPSGF